MSASGGQLNPGVVAAGSLTDIVASSGNVANALATATLPGAVGKTTFIAGFSVTAGGATAGTVVDVQVSGTNTTLHFSFAVPAGPTSGALPLVVEFERPLPAGATNTPIQVTCPALGAGNTNAAVNAHGYQQ